jgi:hypothetical protein
MSKFIALYPDMVIGAVGMLVAIVGYLLKMSVDRLNDTIKALTTDQKELRNDLTELDARVIGHITMCDVCRMSCPERRHEDRRHEG